MGLVTPIVGLAVSAGGIVGLLIIIGLIVLNFWATTRIIAQAGYSPLWILVPLAPFVLTFISYIILLNDLHAALQGGALDFGGIGTNGLVGHLDELSIFLNWVLFLVFAFSRWPVSGPQYARTPDGPRPPDALREGPGPTPTAPLPSAARPARVVPSSGAGPGSGPTGVPSATVAKRPAAQFCPWCAEALPGNRALFHDCGSKDRPESFCKNCGTALPHGSSVCNACGVS